MLAKYESLTDPAYVALLTLGIAGAGLWGFAVYEDKRAEESILSDPARMASHIEMMKKAGLYTAIGGVGLAVAYFAYKEFS